MSRDSGPVRPLEQRCIEPGHWLIEGRHVRAVYQGRSRNIQGWNVDVFDDEATLPAFTYLADARNWIRNQEPLR
jgi:hypothetical protein